MKIVSTGATLFSERHYWKRKEERKKKLILWTTIAVLIIAGLIIIARLPKFLITEVGVEGARVITAEAPAFSGTVYFIYSRTPEIIEPKGREFLPLEEFSPLAEFINGISKLGFEPVSADVGERDVG